MVYDIVISTVIITIIKITITIKITISIFGFMPFLFQEIVTAIVFIIRVIAVLT